MLVSVETAAAFAGSKKREAHRPKKARGALSMQPDDGVDVEDEGDGEDFDEDLEME